MSTVALVVMELGSEWPGWFGGCADVVAFSQGGEKLLRRTEEALGALRRGRQDISVAVFACNEHPEADLGGYRAQIAQALLSAVRGAPSGRLILTASDRAPARVRFELLSLAGALSENLRGTTATVSLRFIESAREETSRARSLARALPGSPVEASRDL
ncbi:MAG: hypothetical protein WBY94_16755 [Polyangiaceae bacterium]